MLRTKSWVVVLGALVGVAALGLALGWGAHALAAFLAPKTPDLLSPQLQVTPTATPDAMATLPLDVLPPTSTLQSAQDQILVQLGESLYQVCRRFCPASWGADSRQDDLKTYAQQVAERNELPWNETINGYLIYPGQILNMLPCPSR